MNYFKVVGQFQGRVQHCFPFTTLKEQEDAFAAAMRCKAECFEEHPSLPVPRIAVWKRVEERPGVKEVGDWPKAERRAPVLALVG